MGNVKHNLTVAEKDLLSDLLTISMGRVVNTSVTHWDRPIPHGVSVFLARPKLNKFEYLYTNDTKVNVIYDETLAIEEALARYGNIKKCGLVLYIHSCMIPIISKHSRMAY